MLVFKMVYIFICILNCILITNLVAWLISYSFYNEFKDLKLLWIQVVIFYIGQVDIFIYWFTFQLSVLDPLMPPTWTVNFGFGSASIINRSIWDLASPFGWLAITENEHYSMSYH